MTKKCLLVFKSKEKLQFGTLARKIKSMQIICFRETYKIMWQGPIWPSGLKFDTCGLEEHEVPFRGILNQVYIPLLTHGGQPIIALNSALEFSGAPFPRGHLMIFHSTLVGNGCVRMTTFQCHFCIKACRAAFTFTGLFSAIAYFWYLHGQLEKFCWVLAGVTEVPVQSQVAGQALPSLMVALNGLGDMIHWGKAMADSPVECVYQQVHKLTEATMQTSQQNSCTVLWGRKRDTSVFDSIVNSFDGHMCATVSDRLWWIIRGKHTTTAAAALQTLRACFQDSGSIPPDVCFLPRAGGRAPYHTRGIHANHKHYFVGWHQMTFLSWLFAYYRQCLSKIWIVVNVNTDNLYIIWILRFIHSRFCS